MKTNLNILWVIFFWRLLTGISSFNAVFTQIFVSQQRELAFAERLQLSNQAFDRTRERERELGRERKAKQDGHEGVRVSWISYRQIKEIWEPSIGDKLIAQRELRNQFNKFSIKVQNEKETIGHLTREYSWYFLARKVSILLLKLLVIVDTANIIGAVKLAKARTGSLLQFYVILLYIILHKLTSVHENLWHLFRMFPQISRTSAFEQKFLEKRCGLSAGFYGNIYVHNIFSVFCQLLPIQGQTVCNNEQYTVVDSDDSFVRCLNCDTCHPGRGLYPPCGSRILERSNIECKDCPSEKFSSEYDSAPCHNCQKCAKHEIIAAPCTNMSDRICNGTCEKGYFYSKKDSTHSCQKCAYCCFDGKDEEISECVNQGLNVSKQHCRPRPDKDCSPVPSSTSPTGLASGTKASKSGSPSKTTIIAGVIGSVVFVALVVLFVHLYRRKKHKGVPQPPGSAEEGNRRTNCK